MRPTEPSVFFKPISPTINNIVVDQISGATWCGCGHFQSWRFVNGKKVITKGKRSKHAKDCEAAT